jgi:hypothetical protein
MIFEVNEMEQWDLEGLTVTGLYLGSIPVKGNVDLSRVEYGGEVSHHVQLESPINIYGEMRERVILMHKHISSIRGVYNV